MAERMDIQADKSMEDTMAGKGGLYLMRGMMGRCPACGEGKLFRAFVKVADRCPACGEDLHHHRADDFPAYLTIFLVGHLVVPIAMYVEIVYQPSYWLHTFLWAPLRSSCRSACFSRSRA